MDEAVSLALANNRRVKDFRQRAEAQRNRVESGKAPFWPETRALEGSTSWPFTPGLGSRVRGSLVTLSMTEA